MCRVLVEMPNRRDAAVYGQSPPLRRSPRFISPENSAEAQCRKTGMLKSNDDWVGHLGKLAGSKRKRIGVNTQVKGDPGRKSGKVTDLTDGLRKSTIPCSGLRRSPRFTSGVREQEHSLPVTQVKDCPERNSTDGLGRSTTPCAGLRRSSRLNCGVHEFCSFDRLMRISNQQNIVGQVERTNYRLKRENRCLLSGKNGKQDKQDAIREQEHSLPVTQVKDYPERNSTDGLGRSTTPCAGLRRSSRLNCGVHEFCSFDRLMRISNQQNTMGQVERTNYRLKRENMCLLSGKNGKQDKKDAIEDGVVNKHEEVFVAETQRGTRQCVLSLPALKKEENGKITTVNESKQGDEGHKTCQVWTKEQEAALQRAYFSAKPTPHFWKKVSRFVPGKSAQECFDKIHSDHLTPTQPRLRSRVNRRDESYSERSPLSASKILKSPKPLIKRLTSKKKSLLAHKTVRQLLQKQSHLDQPCEADLFSELEPNVDPSTKELTSVLVTPDNLQKMQGSGLKCRERSSSGNKKPVSRFCSPSRVPLISPPVLKQVKNRALHEKYLDQLHSREVRRSSGLKVKVSSGEANIMEVDAKKIGAVKAAKHALLSDVNDAINQLRHLQGNAATDSDDDILDRVDDDDDEEDR